MASPAPPAAPVSNGGPAAVRAGLVDAIGLCLLKAAIGAWVLASGFSHVSDDDYARTVIAEQFAHAPRLDPSGTSWLPFPFWVAGSAMMVFGRSLATARSIACVMGVLGVVAPYAAMRAIRVPRVAAAAATAIVMALPWNAWLGVATVPDGWTGALVAAGAIAMAADDTATATLGCNGWAALALLAASLSRYEAWPVCGLLAARSACRAIGGRTRSAPSPSPGRSLALRRDIACAFIAAAGPVLWMAWNAHAHGSPIHFITRVTSFRRAIGAADLPFRDKLLGFPRALADDTPEVVALGLAGLAMLFWRAELRKRWAWSVAAAGVVLAFLVAGDLGDGAPTHHPARVLGSVWWILTGLGVDAIVTAVSTLPSSLGRRSAAGVAAALAIAWCTALPARWRQSPGRGEWDLRDPQIARGLDMRARDVAGADVAPCSFEHFALLAAWGAPERAKVAPRTGEPPTRECPRITER